MTAISFDTAAELAAYVDTAGVAITDIAQIVFVNGRWYIFHF